MNFTVRKILTPADILSNNLTESGVAEYDYTGTTTYNPGDIRKVSYKKDGVTAILPVKTFKAVSSTTAYPPDDSDPDNEPLWEDLGAVNRDRMFDPYIDTSSRADGTEATDPGKIVFKVNASLLDKISLFNVEGTKVTFEVADSSGSTLETTVHELSTEVEDLEEYFFKPFQTYFDVINPFTALWSSELKITIEHEEPGFYPGCGFVVIGSDLYVGKVKNQPQAGFTGFKTSADFKSDGKVSNYPNEESFTLEVRVKTEDMNKVHRGVAAVRDVATIFEGLDTKYDPFTALGVIQDYSILYETHTHVHCNFQIGGIK